MVSEGLPGLTCVLGEDTGYLGQTDANLVCSHTLLESTKLFPASGPLHMQFSLSGLFFPQIFA